MWIYTNSGTHFYWISASTPPSVFLNLTALFLSDSTGECMMYFLKVCSFSVVKWSMRKAFNKLNIIKINIIWHTVELAMLRNFNIFLIIK